MLLRALIVVVALCWTCPARADLQVCNMGDETQSIAIAYDVGEKYSSEGWWVIGAGKCSTVIAGDLTHRFIYWRANATGKTFDGDTYFFCTTPKVFTLTDAGGDCGKQDANLDEFRRMDIGTNKNWRLDLDPPQAAAPGFAPGSYGQPFVAKGLVQECSYFEGNANCDVFIDGHQYRAWEGQGTPETVMRYLRGQPSLAPVQFSADILRVLGTETDIAISAVVPTAPDALQNVRNALQGSWESEDKQSIPIFDIMGSVDTLVMDDLEIGNQAVLSECPGGPAGVGPVLLRQTSNNEPTDEYPLTGPQCFQIVSVTTARLELKDLQTDETIIFDKLF